MTTLVWFRDDLRLEDHPALSAAADDQVVALYVLDEVSAGVRPLGGATKWWLHHSLESLSQSLANLGVPLLLANGPALEHVVATARTIGASRVLWNRRYSVPDREVDRTVSEALAADGIETTAFHANLLFEPWEIRTGQGNPYSVFTPFWKTCLQLPAPRLPLPVPELRGAFAPHTPAEFSDSLAALELLPAKGTRSAEPDWTAGMHESWTPGEAGAAARWAEFTNQPQPNQTNPDQPQPKSGLADYADGRDFADRTSTSRLSPHLRFGEVSPFQVWDWSQAHVASHPKAVAKFRSELGWREFAWHVLHHAPTLATENWRSEFNAFPWPAPDPIALEAWRTGNTGFDLVDAGMRELWATGSMHNRVRMVAASFLIKNLMIDWRVGETWFWDTLVDADQASNPFGWQWVAGSGADAAPYFRVFNPELQAAKFDPSNRYRDRWLASREWVAPIVDLPASRDRALEAYKLTRASTDE